MTTCRSCNQPILWAISDHNKRIPVDAAPVAGGNIRLVADGDFLRALVDSNTIDMFNPYDDGLRYVAHFVTCPQADEWRRK